jgi:predicted nuclease of restriction endonuclease-like RecB superfamily
MLTADHVDARRKGGELLLARLDARAIAEAHELAEAYLDAARAHVGRTREELTEAWKEIGTRAQKRRLAAGIEKLIDDACSFDADEDLDPIALRRAIFLRATEQRRARASDDTTAFDRDAVVAEVASAMGKTAAQLDGALFSDLRGEHVLRAAPILNAASVVDAYELGRAQAILLRAVRVTCEVKAASPAALRSFFAWLKFHRLLFTVARNGEAGVTIVIDGPFSMFESVTKYGLRLALVLPALRTLETWSLVADIRWGKAREALLFRMSWADGRARPTADPAPQLSDEARLLLDGLETLRNAKGGTASPWRAEVASVLLDHPGLGVCIPDLVLRHRDGGEPIYVEVLGFWSRDAVWKRVELAQQGLGARIVFCASSRLRVSAEVLADDAPAALYVFKGKPSARALLERVEQVAVTSLVTTGEGPYAARPCPSTSSSPEPPAGSAKRSPAST